MAENSSESGSWWSSWLSVAKEKSISALNATKRDLTEFVSTVQRDTSTAFTEAAGTVRSYIQTDEQSTNEKGTNSQTPPNNEGQQQQPPSDVMTSSTYDRSQTELESLRSDPSTYCTIPEGQSTDYLKWSTNFDLSKYQEEISRLLVESNNIRKLHSELVPAKVSYESFWHHYFYRVHLLDKAECKRAEIMARVYSQGQLIRWDEEDEETGEGEGGGGSEQERGQSSVKTGSSESFVCISEEGSETMNDKDIVTRTKESPPLTLEIKPEDSDSDWEKWDD